jgi:hypothetical protein
MALMLIVTVASNTMMPVFSNEIAMTQMQNDNASFIMMDAYNRIRPMFTVIYYGIVAWFVYWIGRDIYKFAKAMSTENPET